MLLEFIKPFAHYEIGQTIDPPAGQAELMIQRGWCKKKIVDDKKQAAKPAKEKPTK